jgi:1-acyl-sn-glycerol-3-phosphate acyltransferase
VYFKIILWASAVSLEIIGLENLDAQVHYVFASNHVAWFDVPVIFSALPFWMIPVSKVSIAYIPIFGWLVRLAGTILVERDNHTKCVESMNNGFGSLRERPKSVLLFPEGRRSDDGTLQDFKRGGFMLAIQSKMPVVPIALIGTDKIAGRSFSASIRPRRVTVVVGTPVETTNMDVEDRNKLACSIYTGMFILFMYCLCRIRDGF